MSRDTKYEILKDVSAAGLVHKVRSYISDGWRPIGGVAFDPDDYAYQAMILESTKEKP